jgi:hypothetical protein
MPKRLRNRLALCSAYHRRFAGFLLNRRLRFPSGIVYSFWGGCGNSAGKKSLPLRRGGWSRLLA